MHKLDALRVEHFVQQVFQLGPRRCLSVHHEPVRIIRTRGIESAAHLGRDFIVDIRRYMLAFADEDGAGRSVRRCRYVMVEMVEQQCRRSNLYVAKRHPAGKARLGRNANNVLRLQLGIAQVRQMAEERTRQSLQSKPHASSPFLEDRMLALHGGRYPALALQFGRSPPEQEASFSFDSPPRDRGASACGPRPSGSRRPRRLIE